MIHRLQLIQYIPSDLPSLWRFFSDAHNLAQLTPPTLHLNITRNVFGSEIYAGQVMTYTVRPLFGIPVSWMTEITHVSPMKLFVDEQRKGPYKLWHHQHHFKEVSGGVEMTDLVHYELPFGALGGMAHALVKKKLREIFTYRYHRIGNLFGIWPGGGIQLQID